MAKCVTLQRTNTKICSGSLNKLITIFTRDITPGINPYGVAPDTHYDENFTALTQAWALIVPKNGDVIFNDISIDTKATHDIYIRYIVGITQENWLTFDGFRYDILDVTNVDQNNRYLLLECNISGLATLEASKA